MKDKQVDNIKELQEILDNISMKNTSLDFQWKFEIRPCRDPDFPGWFVQVAFTRPDTETGADGLGRSRPEFVAHGAWESGVVKTGWLLIELTVRHELMEGFRYLDKRIFNPHNSVHALASIQQ